ncbi:MAG: vWA domain-containing protein [Isosphaeraceae bacterium]
MFQDLIDVGTEDHLLTEHAPPPPPPRDPLAVRMKRWLRELDERHPKLSQWAGGRLDIEVPALAVSLGVHLAFLALLATAGYAVHREVERQFQGSVVDTSVDPLESNTYQDLDQDPSQPLVEHKAGSFSPDLATVTIRPNLSTPTGQVTSDVQAAAAGPVDLARLDVQRATEAIVPTAALLGQAVSIKGDGAEHVGSAEGAVDRIAQEIVRKLEKGRTLVVWAFDASGSLQSERERLAKHIETVYGHISQLDSEGRSEDGGLLTAVVGFGQDRKAMTASPTDDPDAIASAIRSVPLDTSGVETTFGTVADIVGKYSKYRDADNRSYRLLVIVVTDEVGDDEANLEHAIDVAVKAKVPVYVLGSQAIFARTMGHMDYTDPKTGRTFRNVPVRQGPESAMLEQARLPFWYGGEQFDVLDSGFGPYALSRLAGATGGIYFVTRLGQTRMGFDPVAMREYRPEWISRPQYEAAVASHPVRKAVIEAAVLTQQNNLPGMPSLYFPPADAPEFKQAMEANQALAARVEYTVNAALEPVTAVAKLRDRETSRRWQAHYDLLRGRLLALKVRTYEYNMACARMKKDPPKFTRPNSNAWRLVPDEEVHASDKAAAAGKQAVELLQKVVKEHPNTPWALLAQRELKDPLGFKWSETYVRPIVRNENAAEAARKKAAMNPQKPPEPPKL